MKISKVNMPSVKYTDKINKARNKIKMKVCVKCLDC